MFKNMRLAHKLALGFGLTIVVAVVVAGQGLHSTGRMNDLLKGIYENNLMPIKDVANANMQAIYHHRALYEVVTASDAAAIATTRSKLDKHAGQMNGLLDKYRKTFLTDKEKELLQQFETAWDAYLQAAGKVEQLAIAGQQSDAQQQLNGAVASTFQVADDLLSDLVNINEELGHEAFENSQAVASAVHIESITVLLLGAILGTGLGYWITRSIAKPMGEAVQVAQTVAAGDLTSNIEVRSADEAGQLLQALRQMNGSLTSMVGDVLDGTSLIASASKQISAGNADLSSRTEQQAAALEQTAASMHELTDTVRQNAAGAQQASQLAHDACELATRGGTAVTQVVQTMGEIQASAKQIVDIIGIIEEIAFQTNILSLNAAVEAARAGKHGQGFSVVASEVRSLAQRSAASSKAIKTLIEGSVGKINEGTRLVGEAGATMEEVVRSSQQVAHIMDSISAASGEQAEGIEQVRQAIAQMDQVTQQNAALVEEAAATAESMEEQAARLAALVAVFKIKQESAPFVSAPRPRDINPAWRPALMRPQSTSAGN
ncbi:methyl-accepting chemotaxis protein [Pseudoduganella sp. R-34]|uniref:methyl-accepting chemotaxis protein n=1 Tax=unclassified Pseudoduganella TaxID=2637179 RepID=UPI003CF8CE85